MPESFDFFGYSATLEFLSRFALVLYNKKFFYTK